METKNLLHKRILSYALSTGIVLVSASALLFSIDKAIAAPVERSGMPGQVQSDWRYVQDGKVYYFDSEGKLCYRLLKESHYRYNPAW